MITSDSTDRTSGLDIGNKFFQRTTSFKYLGSLITELNDILLEIKERLRAGNCSYFSLHHLLKSQTISRNNKITIYRNVICLVVTYGFETYVLTRGKGELLNRRERNILRRIYTPVGIVESGD